MIYVMSDIHGNLRRFRSIMEQIDLQPEDTLYVLGDVIDRHPHGIEILEEIMDTPNIKMLMGNHEYMMLNALYPYLDGLPWKREHSHRDLDLWFRNDGEVTFEAFNALPNSRKERIFDFLRRLPLSYDVEIDRGDEGIEHFKLVHAMPPELYSSYGRSKYPNEYAFSVWKRDFDFSRLPRGYTLVYGHTPTYMYSDSVVLSMCENKEGTAIAIDCGSGFDDTISDHFPFQGRLGCLRLDDMQEFYSEEESIVLDLSEEELRQDFLNA